MSIYYRLLATYIAVVLVVLLVLGLVLSRSLAAFVYRQEELRLVKLSISIDESLAPWRQGEVGHQDMQRNLNSIDQALNTRIWVVDKDRRLLLDSRMRMGQHRNTLTISQDLVEQALTRKVSLVLQVEDMEAAVLLVGIPAENAGAIFLLTPLADIRGTLASIYRLFWPAAALSFLAAAALALFVSRGLSLPLNRLGEATARLAAGDFSQQVEPMGDAELRQLAQSFNHMASQLKQLETMRRDLVASVSHELRTPLTSILGFVQAVRDEKIPPSRRQDYLDRTLAEIRRLSRLVTDLLDLSALEGKAAPINPERIDLAEIINLSIAALEPQLISRQIEPLLILPPGPALAYGEKQRLQQLLMNLVGNTLKHTPPGTDLTIELRDTQDGWEVSVQDDGPGIVPDQLPHIFKPFFRGKEGGTGLGLAIAKALAENHGGTLAVKAGEPRGTKFILTLPRS